MERRNEIHLRISDRELAQIRMKMRQMGIHNLSAYIRKMAIDGYCIRLDAAELMRLSTLLRRCSNNLNQYAKVANTNGHIYHEDIEALKKGQEEIWLSLQKLLAEIADIGQEGGAHGGNQTDRNA